MIKSSTKKWSRKALVLLFVVVVSGTFFTLMIRGDALRHEQGKALLVAKSIEACLPRTILDSIPENPQDINPMHYQELKALLQQVIRQNKEARFAYIYIKRQGKLYFLADSEPETSSGYSPSGQEFTEASQVDQQPFETGEAQVTPPVTDRWGTWVSVEVPIKAKSGEIGAVLGMDYDARTWKNKIWGETAESSVLVFLVILLILAHLRNNQRNKSLREEVALREKTERQIREKEAEYRLLFELNPQPTIIYDRETKQILAVNQAAVIKYGYSELEFSGLGIESVHLRRNERTSKKRSATNQPLNSVTEIWDHRLKNGDIIRVEVYACDLEYKAKNAQILLVNDISETIRIEDELRSKQKQLSNLVSNLPGMVYRCAFDNNYTMEFISEGCARVTGYTASEFVAGTISFNDLILPQYRQSIREKMQTSIQTKSYFEEIYPIKTASGEVRWIWERGRGVFNDDGELQGLEGYIEDYTGRKQTEQQLSKLSRAIEQNPVSIVITDSEGVIEYVNPVFTEITGYESAEVIGQNPRVLKSDEMPASVYREMWETITSGGIWKGEIINRRKSGELYWDYKTISGLFDDQGRILNYVGVGEEITERKRIEQELIKAKERAEESDRLKSAFLANISHEIRTPMNGILGFADLLKSPHLSPEHQLEFIEIIEKSGQRMLSIINDLIDISRIEAGETIIRIKPVDVNRLLKDIHLFFNQEALQKGIGLEFYPESPDNPLIMRTDGVKLNQILTNLIKNAIKFTEEGSIQFGYRMADSRVEFFVLDTGAGIPPDQQELIFERFRQGTINPSRKHEGAGLGLAISKAYVELLGGAIAVESDQGKGAKFIFDLPIELPESAVGVE